MDSLSPSGTVTFLFTDIEGSTKLWGKHPEAMQTVLARHDAILHQAIEANGGQIVKTTGDGCHAVFETAVGAVGAALDSQQAFQADSWDEIYPQSLRVRMALHTGEAEARAGDYYGPAVNRAARLMSIGAGGQTLLSVVTAELLRDSLPEGATLHDLGEHRLKDLTRPEHVFQLVDPSLPSDFPPLKSLESFPNNLPVQLTNFVGRERELVETRRLLSTARLLTFTGSGGTGKSRLSVQLGAELLPSFADGVWLVELAPLADPTMVLPTIAAIFELHDMRGLALDAILTNYLRAKHLLLILDNCEHLIEASARLVDQLLRACPHLKIIVSSREGLDIAGEVVYRVPSLSLPDGSAINLDALTQCESVQLFIERATAHARFTLNERNAPAVVQICQQLDGIPLALELAAARISVFSPDQIASRLGDRFRLLTGGSRTALPRQQTLRAMIDWSYDLLSEPERALLRRLSVFAGGWSFEAVEAICGDLDVLNLLTQLVNKSLIVVDEYNGETRHRLLETIRQYARDKLLEADEATAVRDGHLNYFVRLSEEAAPEMYGIETIGWLNRLTLDHDNIVAALEWGAQQHSEDALYLVGNLTTFWGFRADLPDAEHLLRSLLARVEALPPTDGPAAQRRLTIRAKGLMLAGQVALRHGDGVTARATFGDSISVARAADDKLTLGLALGMWALASVFLGDTPAIRSAAEESAVLFREIGQHSALLLPLSLLAWAAGQDGDQLVRQRYLDETRQLTAMAGTPLAFSVSQLMGMEARLLMSMEARLRGDMVEARLHLQDSLALLSVIKSRHFETMTRSELAHVARQTGEFEEAKGLYRQAIFAWRELGHRAAIAHELECLGFIARAEGQSDHAARLLGAAEALREAINTAMADYEYPEYEHEIVELRQQIEATSFALAWTAGRAMTMDNAVNYALEQAS